MIPPAVDFGQLFEREPLANWNGELMPLSAVKVSVLDRAFLFGDAIYEVIRIYNGKPFLFDEHVARIDRNLHKLNLPTDASRISERIQQTIVAADVESGVVYVQVSRGVAARMHRFPQPPPVPNELIYVAEFHDPYTELRSQGVGVIVVDDLRWKRCDIKSVNLLANCMAAQLAYEAGCPEALFVNSANELVEGTRTSLFGVRDGVILTAPLGPHILPGITRKLIIRLADECGLPISEEMLHRDHLDDIDELFVTGTTTEILPIIRVDQQTIGTGSVGPVVTQLLAAYKRAIQS